MSDNVRRVFLRKPRRLQQRVRNVACTVKKLQNGGREGTACQSRHLAAGRSSGDGLCAIIHRGVKTYDKQYRSKQDLQSNTVRCYGVRFDTAHCDVHVTD